MEDDPDLIARLRATTPHVGHTGTPTMSPTTAGQRPEGDTVMPGPVPSSCALA
jgi:hypothetical protein